MGLIDSGKYLKDLLSAYDDVSMEFEILDRQPLVNAIPIPEGATNGDVIKAMFPVLEVEIEGDYVTYWIDEYRWLSFRLDWWNAPYKGERNLSEKSTGSESEDKGCGLKKQIHSLNMTLS